MVESNYIYKYKIVDGAKWALGAEWNNVFCLLLKYTGSKGGPAIWLFP